jgi:hypothetical protein
MMNDISWTDIIPPFQGLSVWRLQRWTMSIAQIFCAYSAEIKLQSYLEKEEYILIGQRLVHQHKIQSRPDRAIFINTGQRPVYQSNTIMSPVRA